jgi:thiol-disulfide isomerase/thioredoxin
MRHPSILPVLALFALVVVACAGSSAPPEPLKALPTVEPTGTRAVKFTNYVPSDPSLVGTTGRPQVIVFFTFSCAVCQAMRPAIHALQDDYGFMIDFVYLDIDAQNTKALQKRFVVTGEQPTIVFMDFTGQERTRLVGQHTKDEIENLVQDLVAVGG